MERKLLDDDSLASSYNKRRDEQKKETPEGRVLAQLEWRM